MNVEEVIFTISVNNGVKDNDLSNKVMDLWNNMLKNYTDKLRYDAVMWYVASDNPKFHVGKMPPVGMILNKIREIYCGKETELWILSAEEWNKCIENQQIVLKNKRTSADNSSAMAWRAYSILLDKELDILSASRLTVKAMGGWIDFFNGSDGDKTFKRKEFLEKFIEFHREEKIEELKNIERLSVIDSKAASLKLGIFGNSQVRVLDNN